MLQPVVVSIQWLTARATAIAATMQAFFTEQLTAQRRWRGGPYGPEPGSRAVSGGG
jgi:hypothetical protein